MSRMLLQCVFVGGLTFLVAGATGDTGGAEADSSIITPLQAPVALTQDPSAANIPAIGQPQLIATFDSAMPTGVTISRKGRIFVNFPRWGDDVQHSVAEIKDGKETAYPPDQRDPFVGVQSVIIDPADRLWILDTGTIEMGPVQRGSARLICYDLNTDVPIKTIVFPSDVALPSSYPNDVRFDLTKGKEGFAYITDSSGTGPNAIIVVDLQSGRAWRRLSEDPSTQATKDFIPTVEGQPLMERPKDGSPKALTMGADGIALSSDGKRLFYSPLISHELYSVSTEALRDQTLADRDVARTIDKLPTRDFASDGLEMDAQGNLYLTDYEHDAIWKRSPDGAFTTVVRDPRIIWPDTLSIGPDGYLYFTANQLNRQKRFHQDQDLRQKPYALFRVKIDAKPVALK